MDRRSFLRTTAAGAAGALAWRYGGSVALGQVPWSDDERELYALDAAKSATVAPAHEMGAGRFNVAPDLAVDRENCVHCVAVALRDGREEIVYNTFRNGAWEGEIVLGAAGSVLHPRIAIHGKGVGVVWAEKTADAWRLVVRRVENRAADEPTVLAEGGVHWYPAITEDSVGSLWVAWQDKTASAPEFCIFARALGDGGWSERLVVGVGMRPAICPGGGASVWIAWDSQGLDHNPRSQFDSAPIVSAAPHPEPIPGCRNILLAQCTPMQAGERVQITNHPAFNNAPSIARHADGSVWIAWHSNRNGDDKWDIPRWFMLARWDGKTLSEPVAPPPQRNLEKMGQDQSVEFPRIVCRPAGGVIVTGRPSHNFCVQWLDGEGWSPLYRIPKDGWGGRGQHLNAALSPDGDLWVIRRDLNANLLQCFMLPGGTGAVPATKPLEFAGNAKLANIAFKPQWKPLEELEGIAEPLNCYYGDLHGHTWMSDGMGDVDEYFAIRRDYYQDDFASLTDHDTFVGKSILPTEFEYQKEITDHFNADGKFATLFGQEYTTLRPPRGIGHKCIYSVDKRIPLFDHEYAGYDTSAKLNEAVKKWGALIAPHHTGWTGTDWDNADPEIQTFVEIVSNHGRFEFMGNRPIPHRGGMKGHFLQDALAMGLRFGIVGGSDNHGLIWHHGMARKRDSYRTGLACVLAPNLTRASVFDALRRRRVFGTTGIKPRLDFRVNGHLMGEEIAVSKAPISVVAMVSARERIKWMTIVKNNEDWFEFGGEGWESRFTAIDEDMPDPVSFYYLRVEFENEEMAWSSPVWVTRKDEG